MKNIKNRVLVVVFLLSAIVINAQETKKQKMEALKIAYITEKLELTTNEAEKFWPIYKEYQVNKKALRKNNKKNKPNVDEMNDLEIESFINEKFEIEEKHLLLKKEFVEKIKHVLPMKKIAKLLKAEKSFRREVLKRLKEKK